MKLHELEILGIRLFEIDDLKDSSQQARKYRLGRSKPKPWLTPEEIEAQNEAIQERENHEAYERGKYAHKHF